MFVSSPACERARHRGHPSAVQKTGSLGLGATVAAEGFWLKTLHLNPEPYYAAFAGIPARLVHHLTHFYLPAQQVYLMPLSRAYQHVALRYHARLASLWSDCDRG